jgi:predicted nucleic acid-binding protein
VHWSAIRPVENVQDIFDFDAFRESATNPSIALDILRSDVPERLQPAGAIGPWKASHCYGKTAVVCVSRQRAPRTLAVVASHVCRSCSHAFDSGGRLVMCPKCGAQVVPRSATARSFLLDSNAYDPIVDDPDVANLVTRACNAGTIELLDTHIQNDELMNDGKRRDRTLALPAVHVPTWGFVLGTSRLGLAQFGEGEVIDAMRSPSNGHTNDALLAATAEHHGATLVTGDRRLTNVARARGIEVWEPAAFIEYVRGVPDF